MTVGWLRCLRAMFGASLAASQPIELPVEKRRQLAQSERRIMAASAAHSKVVNETMLSNLHTEQRLSAVQITIQGVVRRLEEK